MEITVDTVEFRGQRGGARWYGLDGRRDQRGNRVSFDRRSGTDVVSKFWALVVSRMIISRRGCSQRRCFLSLGNDRLGGLDVLFGRSFEAECRLASGRVSVSCPSSRKGEEEEEEDDSEDGIVHVSGDILVGRTVVATMAPLLVIRGVLASLTGLLVVVRLAGLAVLTVATVLPRMQRPKIGE